jgi:hypothetical protein
MENDLSLNKLAILDKRLKAFSDGYRQNIALLADDQQEISYLLGQYFSRANLDTITVVHVCTTFCGKRDFLKAIAFSLLSSYSKKIDDLDKLIHCLSPSMPSTTEAIKKSLKNTDIDFLSIVDIINSFISETNMRCLLIIDNFLQLGPLFADFYASFSKFIMLQRNCMVVVTESSPRDAKRTLSNELNLLFGNFEVIDLDETAPLYNFMRLKRSLKDLAPSPFFLSFMVKHIGSNSLHYEMLMPIIKEKYLVNQELSAITDIFVTAVCAKNTFFFQKFMLSIENIKHQFKDHQKIIKLLTHMSDGYLRKKELASLGLYDTKNLALRLQKLSDLNYVHNFGSIHKVKDPLFSFWLSHSFRINSNFSGYNLQKRLFTKSILDYAALSREEFMDDSLSKMLQLFSSFKNDRILLRKKKYILPSVNKTKTVSYPEENFHLLIGEGREIIFAGLKEKSATENDILAFLEKGANIKGKGVKKVFITLDTAKANTKLIAKNSKLTIWDVNDINQLLDIYNKANIAWDQVPLLERDLPGSENKSTAFSPKI